jgi:hypothetical protein
LKSVPKYGNPNRNENVSRKIGILKNKKKTNLTFLVDLRFGHLEKLKIKTLLATMIPNLRFVCEEIDVAEFERSKR